MFFSLDSVHVFVQCTLPVNISVEELKARGEKNSFGNLHLRSILRLHRVHTV